jgi:predicted AAA+ superfamily ATPase
LLADLPTLGLLFESLVVRDLRCYADALGGGVTHYRDSDGLEVDAIVQRRDGVFGAFEVKLGQSQVDTAAANLRRFADKIDAGRTGEPAVLAGITGSGYAYTRPDGVAVIPIGSLGP